MPRVAKKKRTRGLFSADLLLEAATDMKYNNLSSRKAAEKYGISCHLTLYRAFNKMSNGSEITVGYQPSCKVFNEEQEKLISDYLVKASQRYMGLTYTNLRQLSYQLAIRNGMKIPTAWSRGKFRIQIHSHQLIEIVLWCVQTRLLENHGSKGL